MIIDVSEHVSYWLSPLGMLEVRISDQSLQSIKKSSKKEEQIANDSLTHTVIDQLHTYMQGSRRTFNLPMRAEGTPFQKAVWKALIKIPAGETKTYGEVAAMIGRPKAVRAVGQALNKNPLCIVVPCHRVTAVDGIGGYVYGTAAKKWLLKHEKKISDNESDM